MPNVTVFPSFWEGFSVVSVDSETETPGIELNADPLQVPRCGGCRGPCPSVHEYNTRHIRDLPMLGLPVLLRVHLRRLACSGCGRCAKWVSWLERHARLTRRRRGRGAIVRTVARPTCGRDVGSALEHCALARTARPRGEAGHASSARAQTAGDGQVRPKTGASSGLARDAAARPSGPSSSNWERRAAPVSRRWPWT